MLDLHQPARILVWLLCLLCLDPWRCVLGLLSYSSSAETDLEIISTQLGYQPKNFVKVAARNKEGRPITIQTYPLDGGAQRRQLKARQSVGDHAEWFGTPFPTLFWLTCPDVARGIAELERKGYVKHIEEQLQANLELSEKFNAAHRDYARLRWASLLAEDRQQIIDKSLESGTVERMRNILEFSGIAGGNLSLNNPPIKCLHTHYAHFRSVDSAGGQTNPVGMIVHNILSRDFPDLIL